MVFYFTGTGNSLYAAKNFDSEYVSIPQILNSGHLEFEADKIGIVCPIYGHEMPAMVKEFLRKAVFHTEYLYVVLTYGNRHANAVELAEKTLEYAGKKADYITTLLMVDNFLPAFDMAEQVTLGKDVERIKPMVNQMETHPHNQQLAAHEVMKKYGIQHEAWAPFGEGRGGLFEDETLKAIGAKYGKSTAQVILRRHIQRGVVVMPKSTHYERMVQNLDVFDFALTDADMEKIKALDKAQSSFFSHTDPAMVEWFAKMVEERKQHDSSREKKSW